MAQRLVPFYTFYAHPDQDNGERDGLALNHFLFHMDDAEMERRHNYVQWVFPNPDRSKQRDEVAQYDCTPHEYALFKRDAQVMGRVDLAVKKMLRFWGILYVSEECVYVDKHGETRFYDKLVDQDHNQLRFTRMLLFLRGVGRDTLARTLVQMFVDREINGLVNAITWRCWTGVISRR